MKDVRMLQQEFKPSSTDDGDGKCGAVHSGSKVVG